MKTTDMKKSVLRVAYPATWGALTPSLQHTVYGDAILQNEFEPLVQMGREGLLKPLAARSWEVSPDFKVFKFKIDTTRKYSDGSPLKALDFKNSWEKGLRDEPKSANSSLKDVLYNIEGFKDFETKGTLSGIVVHDDENLELRFSKTFRMALEHLSGTRFAAYKDDNGKPFGTGRYKIASNSESEINLETNPFHAEKPAYENVKVSVIDVDSSYSKIHDGEIDVYAFFARTPSTSCNANEQGLGCFTGAETGHIACTLNGLNGRFFADQNMRLAMQTLMYDILHKQKIKPYADNIAVTLDPQTFLNLQAGRLGQAKLIELIEAGRKYIPALLAKSQENPVYIVSARNDSALFQALKDAGLRLNNESGNIDFKKYLEMHYKSFAPDAIVGSFSVARGDPDGIYHLLGKEGAITSPSIFRPKVNELLEQGRTIIDRNEMDKHYQKVSEQILKDVPFVHMGFALGEIVYNKNKIRILNDTKSREEGGFHIFEPL